MLKTLLEDPTRSLKERVTVKWVKAVKTEYDATRIQLEGMWLPNRARVRATLALQAVQSFTFVKSMPGNQQS